ncbi:unnamed protein product [Didymodactylos carnosus]|uniref:hydroxymethylbilane synthase n=2 Tax=Didymodactylos carnosus TaxID=1234261 RepID=A0A813QHR9_9BILA|nr:unnamed protein product [Didymodactylos carnosus]CAF3548421.1 unnamed protein product [Didymodactylos carnosus]
MLYHPQRQKYIVGTRRSQLALVQTESVIENLKKFYPNTEYDVVKIKTIGDKNLLDPLANIGDKGLFTKELEIELEKKSIDFVVHSLKDVPSTSLPPNMIIGAILDRADPRDAVVIAPWRTEKSLNELPDGSVIGTSSTRRIAQLKLAYSKFHYKNIRGNMNTRYEKLSDKTLGYDAMIVAVAGLQRLHWTHLISEIIEPDIVLYAIGQGALGIECRHDDNDTIKMLSVLNHFPSVIRCIAERSFLRRIGGGCSVPNAVQTQYDGKELIIDGILLNLDGTKFVKDRIIYSDITLPRRKLQINRSVSIKRDNSPVTGNDGKYSTAERVEIAKRRLNLKRKHANEDFDDEEVNNNNNNDDGGNKLSIIQTKSNATTTLYNQYLHVCCLNIDETLLKNAEHCGVKLAMKLNQKGASNILQEIKQSLPLLWSNM